MPPASLLLGEMTASGVRRLTPRLDKLDKLDKLDGIPRSRDRGVSSSKTKSKGTMKYLDTPEGDRVREWADFANLRSFEGSVPRTRRLVRSMSDSLPKIPADDDSRLDNELKLKPVVRRLWGRRTQRSRRLRKRCRPKRGRDDWNYWRLRRKQRWLIPAEHPLKLLWDVLTVILSIGNAYATHSSIRDRQFGNNYFARFCEVWFVLDILLNFVTEYKCSDGMVYKEPVRVWARYLATWFVIDAVSLFPGELLYIQPLIDKQNQRGFFQKSFFRTKAVIRVTRVLRGRHFRLFGNVAKQTKRAGLFGASRLLHLIIKYVPKYLMFLRNMKAVIVVRLLRQIHWIRKVYLTWTQRTLLKANESDDDGTYSMTYADEIDSSTSRQRGHSWEYFDDYDDPDDDSDDPDEDDYADVRIPDDYHDDDPF